MFAALFAPAGMLARVRGLNRVQLWLLAHGLAEMQRDGERLRYPGEGLSVVAARIDLMVWLAFDPFAARRHLSRTARGWRRARLGKSAPPAFTPPHVPLARAGVAPRACAVAFADSS
ncbi:MAG: hypothetical protein NW200_11620 [Hyphomonadaceae bacterium]|nr:hypothetical protein [Hyphomonadaceae bacterium]